MKTQQLKEELQGWQEHYSDPADKDNYDFFATVIAAIEQLEAAESRLHEVAVACATTEHELEETKQLLRGTREKLTRAIDRNVAKDIEIKRLSVVERERDELQQQKDKWVKRATESCAELDRRDAAAGEPVAWRYRATNMSGDLLDGWKFSETDSLMGLYQPLYAAAPPAVVSDDALREAVAERIAFGPRGDTYEIWLGANRYHYRTDGTASLMKEGNNHAYPCRVTSKAVKFALAAIASQQESISQLKISAAPPAVLPQEPVGSVMGNSWVDDDDRGEHYWVEWVGGSFPPKGTSLYTMPPAVLPQPDTVLAEFYEAASYPDLVRELVKHIEQLQDSAKRNVKPWEDTFPPTLLPSYIDRIKIADDTALGAQPQKPVVLPHSFMFGGAVYHASEVTAALDAANVKWEVKK